MGLYRTERAEKAERAERAVGQWSLWVDEEARPGWANMAIDQTLLDRAERQGEKWLRLYRWEPHCLSFGRHEPASRRYDVERIAELGLDTVRRPTGGRSVWHGRELTYAVASPTARFGSLRQAYLEIHQMLADALVQLGAAVTLAPSARSASVDAGACFALPAGGEVMISGKKVVGSAQLRRGSALLQHGSILIEEDQRIVLGLTRGAAIDDLPPIGAAPLALLLSRPVAVIEVAEAVIRSAAARWDGFWTRAHGLDPILDEASRYFPQFQSPAWTWAR
jgi:lipoate-protein ligase A